MFCPQCGAQADQAIKFCKQCGINLRRIQGVMSRGGASTSWNDVWMEEALDEQRKKRKKTPEEKRFEEIKAGVITTSVGVGATIFLYFLMNAVALTEPHDAAVLRSIWLAGLVPTFIGLGLLFNGVFISKRIVELKRQAEQAATPQPALLFNSLDTAPVAQLPAANKQASVTEHTTARLGEAAAIKVGREAS